MMGPVLFTERLILRPAAAEDLEPFAAFAANADTMRHLGGAKTRSEAWRMLAALIGSWTLNGYSMFSVVERNTGRWVGWIGPWKPDGWPAPEVAWGLASEFAGRGYAYEAAVATIDYAFDVLRWPAVIHAISPENHGSIRLAERLGSTNGGPTRLPPPLHEERVDAWGQTADQWRARRRANPVA